MPGSQPLKFKKLTGKNWTEPDPVLRHFVAVSKADGTVKKLTGDDWAGVFLYVQLADSVPLEVQELFEVARGVCLYGWFFYPLYHLGEEQLFRVADTAIAVKCKQMGGPGIETSLGGRLDWLRARGMLTANDRRWWDSIRELRNLGSHPDFQSIHPPGSVLRMFRDVVKRIDDLFQPAASAPRAPRRTSSRTRLGG